MARLDIIGDDVDDLLDSLSGDDTVNADDLPIGFAGLTETTIAAGATIPVTVPIQAAMRPDRLVMGEAARVPLSRVQQISVGTINLNVGSEGVPCECFAPDAIGTRLRAAVTATPSVPPIIRIFNGTAAGVVYEGAIFGPVKRV